MVKRIEINTVIRIDDKPFVATTERNVGNEDDLKALFDSHNEKVGTLERLTIKKINDRHIGEGTHEAD